jgi:aspartokinase
MNVPGDIVEVRSGIVRITVRGVAARPGVTSSLLTDVGRFGPLLDPTVAQRQDSTLLDVAFVLPGQRTEGAVGHLESHLAEYGAASVVVDSNLALLVVRPDSSLTEAALTDRVTFALRSGRIEFESLTVNAAALTCFVPVAAAEAAASAVRSGLTR